MSNTERKLTKFLSYSKFQIKVEFDWIGEGWSGDYDPKDPDDEPLLRFTVFFSKSYPLSFEQVDDASYCTAINAYTPKSVLRQYLRYIYREVKDDLYAGVSIKKKCEWLSWLGSGGESIPNKPRCKCRRNIKGQR